ncbi:hypothetical protein AVEN_42456-1 [Araneus ventricosus]|uniref:Uncharacterized protein n=1 Tax=Araneus ventricosus TaxID=182803 RepID=A0A4Y2P2B3_ARAVE|nr:hypothetical protein AVEN_42456-1 [Araneus ventricosus]
MAQDALQHCDNSFCDVGAALKTSYQHRGDIVPTSSEISARNIAGGISYNVDEYPFKCGDIVPTSPDININIVISYRACWNIAKYPPVLGKRGTVPFLHMRLENDRTPVAFHSLQATDAVKNRGGSSKVRH